MRRTGGSSAPGRWLLYLPLAFALIGLPLALGAVPPNGFYGVRTASTLASEATWYAANFRAGLVALLLGIPATVLNLWIARSASLGETYRQLLPIGVLLLVAGAMSVAGLSAA